MREKGQGTIYEKDGTFVARLRFTDELGRKREKAMTATIRKEAQARLKAFRKELAAGTAQVERDLTLGKLFERLFAEVYGPKLRSNTLCQYEGLVKNHLRPLRDVRLSKVTVDVLEELLRDASKGRRTRDILRRFLITSLNHAVRLGLVKENMAKRTLPVGGEAKIVEGLSAEDVRSILGQTVNAVYRVAFRTQVELGLRVGEVLGLMWADIDWQARTASIRQQYKFWIDRKRPFKSVEEELSTLSRQGEHYRRLLGAEGDDAVSKLARFLQTFDIGTAYPALLWLMDQDLEDDAWEKIATALESYLLRRSVCDLTNKNYNRVFLSLVRNLHRDGAQAEVVIDFLSSQSGEPGSAIHYSGLGFSTLGRIVEIASKMSLPAFMKTKIFDPLGMKDTTFFATSEAYPRIATTYIKGDHGLVKIEPDPFRKGAILANPAGGLYWTASDMARLLRCVSEGGAIGRSRILSPTAVDVMTHVQTGVLQMDGSDAQGFGLGFTVVKTPVGQMSLKPIGSFCHTGAFGTEFWTDPRRGIVVVFMVQGLDNTTAARKTFNTMVNAAYVGP